MYNRNRIYISESEQKQMRDFKIVFGGLGLGSVIAECALRVGFENLHLIDGDVVELSNLNRQGYTENDIGKPKAVALYEKLKGINSKANITYSNVFLTSENLAEHLKGADVAVNAIDFTSDAPFIFDDVCAEMNIPVVHPYNFGYGGLVFVLTKESESLRLLSDTYKGMEITVANNVLNALEKEGVRLDGFKKMLVEYTAEKGAEPPPQLSIGAGFSSNLCVDIFLSIFRKEPVDVFPNFYYSDKNIGRYRL